MEHSIYIAVRRAIDELRAQLDGPSPTVNVRRLRQVLAGQDLADIEEAIALLERRDHLTDHGERRRLLLEAIAALERV